MPRIPQVLAIPVQRTDQIGQKSRFGWLTAAGVCTTSSQCKTFLPKSAINRYSSIFCAGDKKNNNFGKFCFSQPAKDSFSPKNMQQTGLSCLAVHVYTFGKICGIKLSPPLLPHYLDAYLMAILCNCHLWLNLLSHVSHFPSISGHCYRGWQWLQWRVGWSYCCYIPHHHTGLHGGTGDCHSCCAQIQEEKVL